MEAWQKRHIQQNLPLLASSTTCDSSTLSYCEEQHILTKDEVDELKSIQRVQVQSQRLYYWFLLRVNSFEQLIKILDTNQQTGAVKILLRGYIYNRIAPSFDLETLQYAYVDLIDQLKHLQNQMTPESNAPMPPSPSNHPNEDIEMINMAAGFQDQDPNNRQSEKRQLIRKSSKRKQASKGVPKRTNCVDILLTSRHGLSLIVIAINLFIVIIVLSLFICISPIFSIIDSQKLTDSAQNLPLIDNQSDYFCAHNFINRSYRHITASDSVNDSFLMLPSSSTEVPSVSWFEELRELKISGHIFYERLLNILSRTRCLSGLELDNITVEYGEQFKPRVGNIGSENCTNIIPNLEKVKISNKCISPDVLIQLGLCKFVNLREITITDLRFDQNVLHFFAVVQAGSPNLRSLYFSGFTENCGTAFPFKMMLPSVTKIHYDVTNFNDTNIACENTLVLGNNFCTVFSSLQIFLTQKSILFQNFFQISGCKTLIKLEVKVKYTTKNFHALNLSVRFPNLKLAKIYLNFTSGCPELAAFKNLRDEMSNTDRDFSVTYCSNCPIINGRVYCMKKG